jgi:hypothetical protein
MAIEHRVIPDDLLHEPKGVVSAAANTAYFSSGTSSGVWKKVGVETLKGLAGDSGLADSKVLTDGANGFKLARDKAYGVMSITENGNAKAMAAAVDPTLANVSDYVLFSGTGAPWVSESLYGVTFNTDRLIAPVSGVYDFRSWLNLESYPTNTASVGFRFKVNNSTFSPRTNILKSNSAGDHGNFSSFGLITLSAGDYVQLFVASSAAGNLIIRNANCTLELLRAT